MTTDVQQRDYYQILGVRSDATQQEIDNAYQRLIIRFDSSSVQRSSQNQERLKERIAMVQEAYDILSHQEKREAYGRSLQTARAQNPKPRPAKPDPAFSAIKQSAETSQKQNNIYQDYFGFSEKPFDLTPDPKYLYLSPKHKEVLAHLVYGLQENNGFLKIVGEVGTGKTSICRSFLKELHTDFSIAYIFNPCISELELLQSINAELGLPSVSNSKKTLIDVLNRFLLQERKKGHRVVVIIDEAQDLRPSVLEQLRLLSNLETETEKLIQIVLIGQPELNNLLAREELRQVEQRITIQWALLPLNLEETRGYIQHRLNVAMGKGKVKFTRGAMEVIFQRSRGIPRMINVVADRALMIAYTLNTRKITGPVVRQAVKDLGGLLPEPSWKESFWKKWFPGAAVLAALFFLVNQFLLPDLRTDPDSGRDIDVIVKRNPMEPADPIRLAPQKTLKPPAMVGTSFGGRRPREPQSSPPGEMEAASAPVPGPIAHTGKLSIEATDKLVAYLASLSLADSRAAALTWVLEKWGLDASLVTGDEKPFEETLAKDFGLSTFELNANFDRLYTLNYPAILEISLPNAQGTKYLAFLSTDGEKGVFGSLDRIEMPLSVIDPIWTRKSIVLWKDFEHLPGKFEKGFRGTEAVWLQKNLRLLGYFQGMEAPLYGNKTERAVREFQRRGNIKEDGKFNAESKMLLYNMLTIYGTPKLYGP